MRIASPRTLRAITLLAALTLSPFGGVGVASGAEGVPSEQLWAEPGAALPEDDQAVPFPNVPGVDLGALGYDGEPLDAKVLERIGAPLPDEPVDRVAEIFQRLELGTPQRDGLAGAQAVLRSALAELDPSVGRLRSAAAVAEQRELEADHRASDAKIRLRQRTGQLAAHRKQMAEVAVAAYVSPPDADVLASVLGGAATTTDDLTAGVLFSAKADHDGIVKEDIELAVAVAAERLTQTTAVAERAATRTAETRAALVELEARRQAHRQALQAVEVALITIDQHLPALQTDLDETIAATWRIEDLPGIDAAGQLPIVAVGGIRVHAAIAPNLQALLAHAHSDGVLLGGWGYRSIEQQVMLRRAHCGASPEDVYLKPAKECSPPTAKPGKSMHERGLAVDFHLEGRSIGSHASPAYQWLAANAALYGFYNLPSEPWHWSVNAK